MVCQCEESIAKTWEWVSRQKDNRGTKTISEMLVAHLDHTDEISPCEAWCFYHREALWNKFARNIGDRDITISLLTMLLDHSAHKDDPPTASPFIRASQSESNPTISYLTNPLLGTCTCPGFVHHQHCKHLGGKMPATKTTPPEPSDPEPQPGQHDTIFQALVAAYEDCGYVQKKRAQQLPYTFAGEREMIDEIRPALIKHGISFYCKEYSNIEYSVFTTTKGALQNRCTLLATFVFAHTSGTFLTVQSIGEGMDSSDKASNKAMTGALKYALRQTMLIATGDDPDESKVDAVPQQYASTPAPASQRQPQQIPMTPINLNANEPPRVRGQQLFEFIVEGMQANNLEPNDLIGLLPDGVFNMGAISAYFDAYPNNTPQMLIMDALRLKQENVGG